MAQKAVTFRIVNRRIHQAPIYTSNRPTVAQRHESKRIFDRAIEVFGDESEAILWLKEPKSALQGMTPIQAIKTESGVQQVELMLGRIEHGIFV
jgi:putative toxin-antitoxin system antitoxin component (TIGR02293 family)